MTAVGAAHPPAPVAFLPRLEVEDPAAAYWLRQATLRLRREVCWLWRERTVLAGFSAPPGGPLPPSGDPLADTLDLARYDDEKHLFFHSEETAAFLSELIAAPPPDARGVAPPAPRGGFGWAARELELAACDRFVLGLALLGTVDGSAGTVFGACLSDPRATRPTLALAQRLWDVPGELLGACDPAHAMVRTGVLGGALEWDAPLAMSPMMARQLLFPSGPPPAALAAVSLDPAPRQLPELELVRARLAAAEPGRPRVLPLRGAPGAALDAAAAIVAGALGRPCVRPAPGTGAGDLRALLTIAWLRDLAVYVPAEWLAGPDGQGAHAASLPELPVTILVGEEPGVPLRLPNALPALTVPQLGYGERLTIWREGLPTLAADPALARAAADCARRFRVEAPALRRASATLMRLGQPPRPRDLYAVCRSQVELGELATEVEPRFELAELMLPPRQTRQVEELVRAAGALTAVHHEWGMAHAWREGGLSALFAGPPGTGKTMAAEVIARAVGIPLYRIDLSQVVNKYIGETEKNLRRLFDAADGADVLLFFDEADALFGKRTEVKDAHDRYANLEVSYLLERMERFKGLAILATNRRKDLDEAFLRRLRFLIEFPMPGPAERLRIWRAAIPGAVDASAVDLPFLAERFQLAGGHIRSVVFQACLQSARADAPRRLEMPALAGAVRRELEKLGRPISLDQFGPWAACVQE